MDQVRRKPIYENDRYRSKSVLLAAGEQDRQALLTGSM
jgi:hypothetical protein